MNPQLTNLLLDFPWGQILSEAWELGLQSWEKWRGRGMYELLDYESELELHDTKGKKATFQKRQRMRFLQDHIVAFEDMGWGDGEILLDYACSPGFPVDRYRLDYKTLILISLRQVMRRGDEEEFNIRWDIQDGFLRSAEAWATEVRYPQKRLEISVIFPPRRPPTQWYIFEKNQQRTLALGKETRQKLPDGRWRITWQKDRPRLYETYLLKWEW